MKELIVISGKGGTGKTSLVASFAALADDLVLADCDVDAADLHLIMAPKVKQSHEFTSGREAIIDQSRCIACGVCETHCRYDAIKVDRDGMGDLTYRVDHIACEGCGVCVHFCPVKAIGFPEAVCGEWFVSDTQYGPMVHAKLGVAAENSGKLVTIVRQNARKLAESQRRELILVDGPPGIGCPVIASVTGADSVVVITEPTLSGESDLNRVLELLKHFGIPAGICVNKWDLNPRMTERIERTAYESGALILGRISYDQSVTWAQIQGQPVVSLPDSAAGSDIRRLWVTVRQRLLDGAG